MVGCRYTWFRLSNEKFCSPRPGFPMLRQGMELWPCPLWIATSSYIWSEGLETTPGNYVAQDHLSQEVGSRAGCPQIQTSSRHRILLCCAQGWGLIHCQTNPSQPESLFRNLRVATSGLSPFLAWMLIQNCNHFEECLLAPSDHREGNNSCRLWGPAVLDLDRGRQWPCSAIKLGVWVSLS